MKIVLIAGFSNAEIQKHLTLKRKSILYHWGIKLFRLPSRVGEIREYAPWVVNMISDLEKREGVELHVIGPHIRLKRRFEEFQLRGVYYHFFSSEWTSFSRLIKSYYIWKRLQLSTKYAKRIIDAIKPDIVVLSGTENPAVSVSIFGAKRYPRICLCQAICNNYEADAYYKINHLKKKLELDILNNIDYIGVYCRKHYDLIKRIGFCGSIFKFNYPIFNEFNLKSSNISKEFDFVNFAFAHSVYKGTHDSIRALAILKKSFPKVTLNIVGGCTEQVRKDLNSIIEEFDLAQNVIFTPFFENKNDLFIQIQKSRFALLPCKLDNTSGTMIQSMLLGLPLIVYRTTGTLSFNKERNCVLIAEMDNVEELSMNMLRLMKDQSFAKELMINGRWCIEKILRKNQSDWDRMVRGFYSIIEAETNTKPISADLLFNPIVDD